MKKLIYLIIPIVLLGCDDGDLIVDDLDFDGAAVESCFELEDEPTTSYLFYVIDDMDFETISLAINTTDPIFTDSGDYGPYNLTSNSLEYRKLNGAAGSDYYCNDVPPTNPTTLQTYIGQSGNVRIVTTVEDDDGDGISSLDEGINLLDLSLSRDTDGDGIPDYKDEDDDGDNVLTIDEGVNTDDLSLSLNTDANLPNGDNIPDYLDPDDDGDGVLTIQEDENRDLNPRNDIIGSTANYLNPAATMTATPAINEYAQHSFTKTTTLILTIEGLTAVSDNEEIIFAVYDFGTYVNATVVRETPTF